MRNRRLLSAEKIKPDSCAAFHGFAVARYHQVHLPVNAHYVAASADKDIPGMFRVLAPHFRRFYLTRYLGSSRAVPPERLAEMLPPQVERVICQTPAEAWRTQPAPVK